MLRVATVRSEAGEDTYLQTTYFYVPEGSANDVDNIMQRLSKEHGFDAELL